MEVKRVAIVGVNPITTSIALTLKARKDPPEIVGYDRQAVAVDLARARGALDKTVRKVRQACENASLIIIGAPLAEIRETFTAIAPHLQPGCLVTDTAHLKAPVMQWAEELLPESVSFIGGHPVLNPAIVGLRPPEELEAAHADLLREALYCYTLPAGASNTAVDAFLGLVRMTGARPFSIDATEHDGMQAGIEGLPDLLAVALLRATVDTPGWQEMRKFAGRRFATTTETADDAHERHADAFLNRKNIVARLDILLKKLAHLRDLLAQDDAEALEEAFVTAADSRARLTRQQERGMWGRESSASMDIVPTAREQLKQMLLGERRPRKDKDG
jgi:prephenate dehydrogenase